MKSPDQLLEEAEDQFDAGNFSGAESLCREALALDPEHAGALALLGSIALQARQPQLAVQLLSAAAQRTPVEEAGEVYFALAVAQQSLGAAPQAIISFRRAVELDPELADAWQGMGVCLQWMERFAEAIEAYRRALALEPDRAIVCREMARCLHRLGRFDEALVQIDRTLVLEAASDAASESSGDPTSGNASAPTQTPRSDRYADHHLRGMILEGLQRFDEAAEEYLRSVALRSPSWNTYNNLANVLRRLNRPGEAVEYFQKACELDAGNPQPCINLGHALARDLCRFNEARDCFMQAIDRASRRTGIMTLEQAIAHFDAQEIRSPAGALGLPGASAAPNMKPPSPARMLADAHANLGMIHLMQGDFRQGWRHYHWRLTREEFAGVRQFFKCPTWDGSPLNGRAIAIYAEQGMGDVIQFARYIPLVAERGGKVTFICQPELRRLMMRLRGVDEVIVWDDLNHRRPDEFQSAASLLELAMILGATLDNIPAAVPYLWPDEQAARVWRDRLRGGEGEPSRLPPDALLVGLAWAGRPSHGNDMRRSFPLAELAPLAEVAGRPITFISLQKGPRSEEAINPPPRMRLLNFETQLEDFADTADLISQLDLVITADTAIAHLAGAMAKAVWTLLPLSPDWRWLLDRSDSPWYPTMRLYRQGPSAKWPPVIERVADDLARFTPKPAAS